ncbi:hypothetical protein VNO77_41938 [Canavalia gladiata]|uniref:Uncharacterized protein n=1 Tax=Canavalia gladiata TaxID=3824 RepID=A0AAN9K1K5_CANGL
MEYAVLLLENFQILSFPIFLSMCDNFTLCSFDFMPFVHLCHLKESNDPFMLIIFLIVLSCDQCHILTPARPLVISCEDFSLVACCI